MHNINTATGLLSIGPGRTAHGGVRVLVRVGEGDRRYIGVSVGVGIGIGRSRCAKRSLRRQFISTTFRTKKKGGIKIM